MPAHEPTGPIPLSRRISLPLLVLYGLGQTIGAGIYALVGEVAGAAGYGAPLSFLLAALLAAVTALSYAELSGRYPRAAGAALYVQTGLGSARLGAATGLLVVLAGLVSSAALINAFIGQLAAFVPVDRTLAILLVAAALGLIAAWGILESLLIAGLVTLLEIGGLLLVIGAAWPDLATLPARWPVLLPEAAPGPWLGVLGGMLLAFYAFLGFEDMVDVAEEVRDVRRNLPLAILATLGLTTVLYVAIMAAAVLSLPPSELAASAAPLARLYAHHAGIAGPAISIIGLFAIINGALISLIMASRVLYGLSRRGQLPAWLGRVHPGRRTPVLATILVTAICAVLALIGRLASLAETTSLLMLGVFALINLSLWRIKRREPAAASGLPAWLPLTGMALNIGLIGFRLFSLTTG
ncbi:amino acid permease-associated protein [Salinisphaera sp. PC39]|uniref:APC family permease n=1 Tax=Salinisphaera sp. PC39 TaxID=1304156 RepID=UPI003342C952